MVITTRATAAVTGCEGAWTWAGFSLRRRTTGAPHQRCCTPSLLLLPPLSGSKGCLPSCQCVRWRRLDPEAALYSAPVRGWTLGQAGFAGQYGSNWRGRSAFHSADAAPPPSCGRPVFTTPRLCDSNATKDGKKNRTFSATGWKLNFILSSAIFTY